MLGSSGGFNFGNSASRFKNIFRAKFNCIVLIDVEFAFLLGREVFKAMCREVLSYGFYVSVHCKEGGKFVLRKSRR